MRLPHQYFEDLAFTAGSAEDLIIALGISHSLEEAAEIRRLAKAGLPPVTSHESLSVMTGFNAGFLWSILSRPEKHYRIFKIPKGRKTRQIEAPRVALKMIQKWLSVHFEKKWNAHNAVHGFVRGRSYISAAKSHLGAEWIASVDIKNFFPSTTIQEVVGALHSLGYERSRSINLLTRLCCFQQRLSQGAPTSPVLSNIALHRMDQSIDQIASEFGAKFTRYADDIVLSGKGQPPGDIIERLERAFNETPWKLSAHKRHVARKPECLKVHGLLVHGERLKIAKSYRNRIRTFLHLSKHDRISEADRNRINGHLNYAAQIDRANEQKS